MLGTVSSDLRCWIIKSFIFDVFIDITITMTFLHSMTDHDAIQLAANQPKESSDAASTLLGTQKIDTHAPLILHSSLFLIISLFFSF